MSEPAAQPRVEVPGVSAKAGALVLASLVLGVLILALAAYRQGWFAPVADVRLILPDEGTYGLQEGARVDLLGTTVGSVRDIHLDPGGHLQAVLRIRKEFMDLVRSDSHAIIRLRFGVVGDAYIELTRGRGPALDPKTATLRAQPYEDVLQTARVLLQRINDPQGDFDKLLQNAVAISADLRELRPVIRKLAGDEELAGHLREAAGRAETALKDLKVVADSLADSAKSFRAMTATLDTMNGEVRKLRSELGATRASIDGMAKVLDVQLREFPSAMAQFRTTLTELEPVVRSLQATTDRLPALITGLVNLAEPLPDLLVQTQVLVGVMTRTFNRLDLFLGGSGSDPAQAPVGRLSPAEAPDTGGKP